MDETVKKNERSLQNKILTSEERAYVKTFLLGDPIVKVKEGSIKADKNGTAIENAKKWAKAHAQEIMRPDIGKVVFDSSGVRTSLSHKFSQRKHEIFDISDLKNTAIPFQTPGADLTARPQRGIAIYLNILRDILGVKSCFQQG